MLQGGGSVKQRARCVQGMHHIGCDSEVALGSVDSAKREYNTGLALLQSHLQHKSGRPRQPARLQIVEKMAERTGLEPATPGVTGRYSNQLNYRSAPKPLKFLGSGGC